MTYDPHNTASIPVGTMVVALNGEVLGTVREVHAHYVLVDQAEEHNDLAVPVHSIVDLVDGRLLVSINRGAATEVDHEETVHRQHVDAQEE
jgi:hypothetical protein